MPVRKFRIFFILAGALFMATAPQPGEPSARSVQAYVTLSDASRSFSRDRDDPQFVPTASDGLPAITIDAGQRFQTIDGFGAALTGSAADVIARMPDGGNALLDDLFRSDSGIGLSYVRLTAGASDFSLTNTTYDDMPAERSDPALAAFSIDADAGVVALARAIRARSQDVRFMASPWSAPAWMKTTQTLAGGQLRPDAYRVYARYLVAYVRALHARGVVLDALSVQNEPAFDHGHPAMTYTAAQEAAFVRSALGPELQAAFPRVKLLAYDGNWDDPGYPLAVLNDPAAARYLAGTAFHCYAGDVAQMSAVHDAFPHKAVLVSECGGGSWAPAFAGNLAWDVRNLVIGATEHWARTVLFWNLALDASSGPTNHGCLTCRGVVTVNAAGTVTRNVEYYVLEHVAKFVRPGAVRIGSPGPPQTATLPHVAFRNTDGSTVLIVLNDAAQATAFAVRERGSAFAYRLPAGAVVTFHWR